MKDLKLRQFHRWTFSGVRKLIQEKPKSQLHFDSIDDIFSHRVVAHDYDWISSWILPSGDQKKNLELRKDFLQIHSQIVAEVQNSWFYKTPLWERSLLSLQPTLSPYDDVLSLERWAIALGEEVLSKVSNPSQYEFQFSLTEGSRRRILFDGTPFLLLTQFYQMNSAHQHLNPELNPEENLSLFYNCSRLHGHEYKMELTLKGTLSENQHEVLSEELFDQKVRNELISTYDKKYLNDFFGDSSGEVISQKLSQECQLIFPNQFRELVLRETENNSFYNQRE